MHIKIISKKFAEGAGYDLQVINEEATLQDYLDAINDHILEGEISRSRAVKDRCEGCDTCCAERIPLTLIDLLQLQAGLKAQGKDISLDQIIKRYANVIADGRVVDITLGQNMAGKCLFLDQEQGKCTVYNYRPLVCQTYICAPLSERASKLRESITNIGEDQLVKWSLENIPEEELYHEVWEPEVDPHDWMDTPFKDKGQYSSVRLKDICPPKLWEALKD